MAKDRIYLVAQGDSERLVRASRGSVALMHVASNTHQVRVATQNDLERLLPKTKVEDPGAPPAQQQGDAPHT